VESLGLILSLTRMHWSLLHIQYTILNFANEYIKLYLNNFLWRVSVSLMFVSRDPSVNFTTYFSLSAQQRSQCKFGYMFFSLSAQQRSQCKFYYVFFSLSAQQRSQCKFYYVFFSLSAQQRSQCKFCYVFLVCQHSKDPRVNVNTCF
jgi:hypothetical protein